MEKDDLVRSTLEASEAGPAKRSVQLTSEGKRCLLRWQETLRGLQEAISELLERTQVRRSR
jgi:DNA-binding PadR family transcriptional regulator